MDTSSFKTISANKNTVEKNWVLVDADGQTLGRLASKVAILLRGKHKPNFTPGGQRSLNALQQFAKNPNSIIEKSVKGMLPKNKLGANLFRNLHVFTDSNHKFEAQKPSTIDLNKVN